MRNKKYYKVTEKNYDAMSGRILQFFTRVCNDYSMKTITVTQDHSNVKYVFVFSFDTDVVECIATNKYTEIRLSGDNAFVIANITIGDKFFIAGNSIKIVQNGNRYQISFNNNNVSVENEKHRRFSKKPVCFINGGSNRYYSPTTCPPFQYLLVDGVYSIERVNALADLSSKEIYETLNREFDIDVDKVERPTVKATISIDGSEPLPTKTILDLD